MILIRFALRMIGYLIVENRPQHHLAIVLVVAINVLISAVDDFGLMFVLKFVLNLIFY